MKVAVVGTGYVGLVTGACLADRGHTVTCVDVDPARVATLERRPGPFHEPGLDEIVSRALAAGRLRVTGDLASAVRGVRDDLRRRRDAYPGGGHRPRAVLAATEEVGRALADGADHVVVVKSTVVPGRPRARSGRRSSGRRGGGWARGSASR